MGSVLQHEVFVLGAGGEQGVKAGGCCTLGGVLLFAGLIDELGGDPHAGFHIPQAFLGSGHLHTASCCRLTDAKATGQVSAESQVVMVLDAGHGDAQW